MAYSWKKSWKSQKFCFCWLPEGAGFSPSLPGEKKQKSRCQRHSLFWVSLPASCTAAKAFSRTASLVKHQKKTAKTQRYQPILCWLKNQPVQTNFLKCLIANSLWLKTDEDCHVLTPHLFIENTCTKKKHTNYGCWFRNPANQLIYVGYSIIYRVLAPSPGGDCRISQPSTNRMFLGTMPCACVILGVRIPSTVMKGPGREDRING